MNEMALNKNKITDTLTIHLETILYNQKGLPFNFKIVCVQSGKSFKRHLMCMAID